MRSKFTTLLFKYFSYRFVWADDYSDVAYQKVIEKAAWIGTGPPHGVMPFANLLSILGRKAISEPLKGN